MTKILIVDDSQTETNYFTQFLQESAYLTKPVAGDLLMETIGQALSA